MLDLAARRAPSRAGGKEQGGGGSRYLCFDGLRAVAALTVIGVHTSFVTGLTTRHPGWGRYTSRLEIGVQVFFVISGFLLYRPFAVAHFGGRSAPAARTFWIRRLKRIVPAYWVAFIFITYVLRAESGGPGWKGPLVFLSFTQIYFPHYILNGLSQAWSLCTEMTFYLMIPLYAYVLGRKARAVESQLRAELTGLAALTVVSFIYRIPVLMAGSPPPGPATRNLVEPHRLVDVMPSWLPAYADQFALGMLLAVGSAYLVTVDRKPAWLWHPAAPWVCWSLAALAFWAVSNIGLPLEPVKASPVGLSLERQTLYGLFAFFLVVPAVFGPQDRGLIRATLQWRPLALVGVVSYGVYLWHEGWMHMYLVWSGDHLFDINWFAMTAAVTVLAMASATLSYRLVERPVQRSGWGLKPSGGPRFRRRLAPAARVVTLIGARS